MMKVLCGRYIQTRRHICTHEITFTHLESVMMMIMVLMVMMRIIMIMLVMMMMMILTKNLFITGETKDLEIEKKGGEIQALTSTLETAKV